MNQGEAHKAYAAFRDEHEAGPSGSAQADRGQYRTKTGNQYGSTRPLVQSQRHEAQQANLTLLQGLPGWRA